MKTENMLNRILLLIPTKAQTTTTTTPAPSTTPTTTPTTTTIAATISATTIIPKTTSTKIAVHT